MKRFLRYHTTDTFSILDGFVLAFAGSLVGQSMYAYAARHRLFWHSCLGRYRGFGGAYSMIYILFIIAMWIINSIAALRIGRVE